MSHDNYPVLNSLEYRFTKDNSDDVIETTVEITIPKGFKLQVQFIPVNNEK